MSYGRFQRRANLPRREDGGGTKNSRDSRHGWHYRHLMTGIRVHQTGITSSRGSPSARSRARRDKSRVYQAAPALRRLRVEPLEDRRLLTVSLVSGLVSWDEQGPGPISGGQVEGLTDSAVAGAVQAIAVDPNDSNVVYLGSVNGGIWKTDDVTEADPTWRALDDQLVSLSISALAVSKLNSDLVFAGSGRVSSAGRQGIDGGLFKSVDGGENWAEVGKSWAAVADSRSVFQGKTITAIALSYADVNRVFVATASGPAGLWLSTDGGEHFAGVTIANDFPEFVEVSDVVADPANPGRLYAAVANSQVDNGIYRSTNDGATWQRVSADPINGIKLEEDVDGFDNDDDGQSDSMDPDEGMQLATRIRLAVSKASPQPLYAAIVQAPRTTVAQNFAAGGTVLTVTDTGSFEPGEDIFIDAEPDFALLRAQANATSNVLVVNSAAEFAAGDYVEVSSAAHNERHVVQAAGTPGGVPTITLVTPLQHTYPYPSGSLVIRVRETAKILSVDAANNRITLTALTAPLVHNHRPGQQITLVNDRERLEGVFRATGAGTVWTGLGAPTTPEFLNGAYYLAGVNPGGQGNLHFSIVADPTIANVVYVGGDRQPAPLPNSIGARNLSGRLFIGDSLLQPSIRWQPITHNFADPDGIGGNPGTAPHADSRAMAFAGNDLLEADDGGIYRLKNPSTLAGREWESINGDLRVGEMYSVAYDRLNNVVLAGNQDTGVAEQVNPGQPYVWRTVLQGDGSIQAVEVVDANTVNRYSLGGALDSLTRRTVETGGLPPEDEPRVRLAAAAGAANLSGLRPGGVDNPGRFVLNAVEPSRMLLGFKGLYESTTLASRGDVIKQIGPPLPSQISAMAYGGRDPDGTPHWDVIYVVAADGYLRVRLPGSLPNEFVKRQINPPSGAVGLIKDLMLDPDNWRIVYAVDDNHVYKSINEGVSWSDITGTFPAILPGASRDFRTIEIVKTTAGKVVLVGGNGGVYRTADPAAGSWPVWTELGMNLPNVMVYDLRYDEPSHVLIAGTLGRGAWKLTDAHNKLAPHILVINGDDNPFQPDDEIRLVRRAANPTILDVFVNNTTPTASFSIPLAAVNRIEVNGIAGNDRLIVDSSHGPISVPDIDFDGGTGATNTLELIAAAGQTELLRTGPTGGVGTSLLTGDGQLQSIRFKNVQAFPLLSLPPSGKFKQLQDGLLHLVRASGLLSHVQLLGLAMPVIQGTLGRTTNNVSVAPPRRISDPVPAVAEAALSPPSPLFQRLIESGLGAFSIAEIGSLLDAPDTIRAALDGLDEVPGNVSYTEVGDLITFDVRLEKTLGGLADLSIDALNGALELTGVAEITADLALHIVFGVDAGGFFIDPNAAGEPELTVGNVRIGGDVSAVGRFGLLGVTMDNATLAMDPGVTLAVDLADPGTGSADGLIRAHELQAAVTDWASATITGNPLADDMELSARFAVAPLSDGFAAPFELTDAQVRFSWADITNLTGVQIAATTGTGQDLLDFLSLSTEQVIDGITDAAELLQSIAGVDLLGTEIPLVGKSLGEILDTPPLELEFAAGEIYDISSVEVVGSSKKFTVSLVDGNLWKQNVTVGDQVVYRGAAGEQFVGQVDEIGFARFVVRFTQAATQEPDRAAPSFRILRSGALEDQLRAALGRLTDPVELAARAPTLQSLIVEVAEATGTDPEDVPVSTSGSGNQRVIEIGLPFDPDPMVFRQQVDLAENIEGLLVGASGDLDVTVDAQFLVNVGLRVGAGIAAQDRFYLVDDFLPEVLLNVTAQLDDPNVVGTLGFLQVRLDEDPAVAPNSGIDLNGTFTVNLTDPGTAMADGRIDRSEFQSGNLTDVFDASVDAFFQHDACAFAGGIEHARRLGVVVEPPRRPVVHQHREVEIVRLDDRTIALDDAGRLDPLLHMLAVIDDSRDALVERDRRDAGRTGEAFLQASRGAVDLPGVHLERVAGERRGAVGVEDHVVPTADRPDRLERLQHRRRGVALADRQHFRPVLHNRGLDLLGREHAAPGGLDGRDVGTGAPRDLGLEVAEAAEDGDQHLVARRQDRVHAGLDAGARGAVDHQRPVVGGTEHSTVKCHHLVHVFGELRIELALDRHRHGAQHARVEVDGTGAHQQAWLGLELAENLGCLSLACHHRPVVLHPSRARPPNRAHSIFEVERGGGVPGRCHFGGMPISRECQTQRPKTTALLLRHGRD